MIYSDFDSIAHLAGALIAVPCLIAVILFYVFAFSFLRLPSKVKHSLINIWTLMALLVATFSFIAHYNQDVLQCKCVAICIHFVTISCLLWMLSSALAMYNILTKRSSSPSHNVFLRKNISDDDCGQPRSPLASSISSKGKCRLILGYYLVGYGVAVMVCISSFSFSVKNSDIIELEYNFCLLQLTSGHHFVYFPIFLLMGLLILIYFIIICHLGGLGADFVSLGVNPVSFKSDFNYINKIARKEHAAWPYKTQLFSQIILFILFLFQWICMLFLTSWRPFTLSSVTQLISDNLFYKLLYSFSVFLLTIYIVTFYFFSQKDVREIFRNCVTCKNNYHSVPDIAIMPKVDVIRSDIRTMNTPFIDRQSKITNFDVPPKDANHGILYEEISDRIVRPFNLISQQTSSSQAINGGYGRTNSSGPSIVPDVFIDPRLNMIAKRFFEKNRREQEPFVAERNNLNIQESPSLGSPYSTPLVDSDAMSCLVRLAPKKLNNQAYYPKAKSDIVCWSSSKSTAKSDRHRRRANNIISHHRESSGEAANVHAFAKPMIKKPATIVLPPSSFTHQKLGLKVNIS